MNTTQLVAIVFMVIVALFALAAILGLFFAFRAQHQFDNQMLPGAIPIVESNDDELEENEEVQESVFVTDESFDDVGDKDTSDLLRDTHDAQEKNNSGRSGFSLRNLS